MSKSGIGRFYEAFVTSFDKLYAERKRRYEDGLSRALSAIKALLEDSAFSPSERLRIRCEGGRVKERDRLLAKAAQDRYIDRIKQPSDVFTVITDIFGARVTCNTVRDARRIAAAIQESKTLIPPTSRNAEQCCDDYVTNPKESGYRGIHVLVGVNVPVGGQFEELICEIQIRTLLQHAWGELTHEDTFKPEIEVPELVQKLSKRLATTLSVLDEIAQDLRDELETVAISGTESDNVIPERGGIEVDRGLIEEIFKKVFDRAFIAKSTEWRSLLASGRLERILPEEMGERLRKVRDAWKQMQSESLFPLPDGQLLLVALQSEDDRTVERLLREAVNRIVESIAAREQFLEEFAIGMELLGTAMRVTKSYVVFACGSRTTAIASKRTMPWLKPADSLEHYVKPGGTVRLKIVDREAETRRLEVIPVERLEKLDKGA